LGRLIAFHRNLDYFERMMDQVRDHDGILREVTEMFVSSLIKRPKLTNEGSAMAGEFKVTLKYPRDVSDPFSSTPERIRPGFYSDL
jgi:hypothetical protein